MDRQIVYPASIPLDTDILNAQRSTMISLGFLAQATLGTSTVADGLACTPQTVPNLTFNVGPGSMIALSVVDANAYGSLPADSSDALVKMGVNIGSTLFTVTAPTTSGQSINYLIQGSMQESDATAVVLPYYNSANPAVPFSGPSNSGAAQNTQRLQRVNLGMKAGTPGTTGSQSTPAPDSGFVGLWVVTVAFAQTTVVSANIAQYPTAPFIGTKISGLRRKLTGNMSLYVNGTTGSDSNNGYAPSTALLTLQGAWNRIMSSLDLAGFSVTVNVADGNYAPAIFAGVPVGASLSPVTFLGDSTTPTNCSIAAVNNSCFIVNSGAQVNIAGFGLSASGTGQNQGYGVYASSSGSTANITGNMNFGSCANSDMIASGGGEVFVGASYSVSGTSGSAWGCQGGGIVNTAGVTVTLVGTPNYTNAFAQAVGTGSNVACEGVTFIGSATGTKYEVSFGGFINTNSIGNVNFLPGSTAGTSTTGYYN